MSTLDDAMAYAQDQIEVVARIRARLRPGMQVVLTAIDPLPPGREADTNLGLIRMVQYQNADGVMTALETGVQSWIPIGCGVTSHRISVEEREHGFALIMHLPNGRTSTLVYEWR